MTVEQVLLRRPFNVEEISFKPGGGHGGSKMALFHADMRSYYDRLDEVFPDWASDSDTIICGDRAICTVWLEVNGVIRSDVGEQSLHFGFNSAKPKDPNAITSAKAQAFKRACTAFGVGAYLYGFKNIWGEYDGKFTKDAIAKFTKILKNGEYRYWETLTANGVSVGAAAQALVDNNMDYATAFNSLND